MMLHFARAPIIVLTLGFKKCFIKHQESTVRFIVMAAQESVIFIHVPKAAGTTLNRLIEWEYPLFEMYSVDPVLSRRSRANLWQLPQRVFKGHMPFELHEILPQPATYITVLRRAVERVLSAYYFMNNYVLHPSYWKFRQEGWTLEDLVRRSPRENVQTKMIAGADYDAPCTEKILAKAKENLQYFSVIGLTERFEESLALMKLRFGWKLESYSSFNVTRTRPQEERPAAIYSRPNCRAKSFRH